MIVADRRRSSSSSSLSLNIDNDLGASHFRARSGIFLNEPSPLQKNRVDLSCGVQWRVASGGIVFARSLLNAAECLVQ